MEDIKSCSYYWEDGSQILFLFSDFKRFNTNSFYLRPFSLWLIVLLFSKTVQQIQREAPGEQLISIYIYKYFSMLVFLK